jgi:hypothetical protein
MTGEIQVPAGEEARELLRSMGIAVPASRETVVLTSPIDESPAYMRRQTQTVNYGVSLPLARGVEFEV